MYLGYRYILSETVLKSGQEEGERWKAPLSEPQDYNGLSL